MFALRCPCTSISAKYPRNQGPWDAAIKTERGREGEETKREREREIERKSEREKEATKRTRFGREVNHSKRKQAGHDRRDNLPRGAASYPQARQPTQLTPAGGPDRRTTNTANPTSATRQADSQHSQPDGEKRKRRKGNYELSLLN